MGEVCDGMRALAGKLNYLGMDNSPAKSTAGDALRDRDEELFRLFYFVLVAHFSPFLSVSRKKKHRKEGVSFEEFYLYYVRSTSTPLIQALFHCFPTY